MDGLFRNKYQMLLVVLISALSGYWGSSFASKTSAATPGSDVVSCNELQILGRDGLVKIRLSTSDSGPVVKLTGKDEKQSLILEIVDTIVPNGPLAKMARIKFLNKEAGRSQMNIIATEDQSAYIEMGDDREAGYVNLSSYPSGDHPMSNLYVGAATGYHFECLATPNTVKSTVGLHGSEIKLGKSKSDLPYASLENSDKDISLIPSIHH